MNRQKRPAPTSGNDAAEAAWIADEDRFVLQQAKKKAILRAKSGRAQPIDWLAITLTLIDPDKNGGVEEELGEAEDLRIVEPEAVFEGLRNAEEVVELEKGIEGYLALERWRANVEYWNMMKTIAKDRRSQQEHTKPSVRGVSSVSGDLDKLLGPKNLEELEKLEKQINTKLSSNQPIDTDYWEHLLKTLLTYKARARLRKVSRQIVDARMSDLRDNQVVEASALRERVAATLAETTVSSTDDKRKQSTTLLDPEPMLRLESEDKALSSMSETDFNRKLVNDRERILRQGYIPMRRQANSKDENEPPSKRLRTDTDEAINANPQTASQVAFDREVARGLGTNEELLTKEEPVQTRNLSSWSSQYRPRKPKYLNRVLLGYEWNKYNQTHYDAENPPPRVVQGYRFNVFYPDLVDKTKAPTYRIEREGGRRRGQSLAKPGEDDECVIRFVAGPPYEDVAFRIIDREWDYSAKRERGFRSHFDKGILQLHFQFKKVYYRK